MRVKMGLLACVLFLLPASAVARTWLVRQDGSGDCATIQACINTAEPSDSVVVGDGIYYEHLIIQKPLSLVGEHSATLSTIDGQRLSRVLECSNIAAPGIVIARLTITNGQTYGDYYPYNLGGGIFLLNCTAEIKECTITLNRGGNIGIDAASSATVHDNNITESRQWLGAGSRGVECHSSAVTIHNNYFHSNTGSGIYAIECSPLVERNLVEVYPNRMGIGVLGYSSAPIIRWNEIVGTSGTNGVYSYQASPLVENNTIVNHREGVRFDGYSTPTYRNNVIARNTEYGFLCVDPAGPIAMSCNDLWSNAKNYYGCWMDTTGNFSTDPLFCDAAGGNYSLSCYSPCVNYPGCGPIGANGAACGPTPITPTTWGRIKTLYR